MYVVVVDDEIVMLPTEDAVHLGLPGLDQVVILCKVGLVFPAWSTSRFFTFLPTTKRDHVEIHSTFVPDMSVLSLSEILLRHDLGYPVPGDSRNLETRASHLARVVCFVE